MSESTITPADAVSVPAGDQLRAALVKALRRPRYEVLPLAGTPEQVEEHVPREIPVTVTSSPRRGLEATLALTETLASRGFEVVPHLAARQVLAEAHLTDILHRLDAAGVRDVFVIAGDCEQPIGDFSDSIELLVAMQRLRRSGQASDMGRIGVAGYPEGHPLMAELDLDQALRTKQSLATYAVSQMCFDAGAISTWLTRARRLGVALPLHVGIPGVVDQRKLLRIVRKIGVGPSAAFLRKQRYGLVRLLRPGGYRPDALLRALSADLADPARGMAGLHVYTLGDVAATERWRRRTLDRLSGDEAGHA